MSSTEDRLRTASRETAREITADSVPPLRLPPGAARSNGAGDARSGWAGRNAGYSVSARSRSRRWLAPAAAAAALLVIAIGTTVIATLAHTSLQPHGAPAAPPGHAPSYYVALEYVQPHAQEGTTRAAVTSTATGAVLATVGVPAPYVSFTGVSAAADDRTFVLAARRPARHPADYLAQGVTRFFKLTINPASTIRSERTRLTALPVPTEPRGTLVRFALSPDGSKLAVNAAWLTPGKFRPERLSVFDLRTGAERTWTLPLGFGASPTWLADNRTVALAVSPSRAFRWQVVLLDTTAPGTSFAADTRVAARISSSPRLIWREVMITPDGRTLLVVRETPIPGGWPITGTARLDRYDVRTGKMTGIVDARKVRLGEFQELQWSSPSGRVLISLLPMKQPQSGPGIHTERTAVIIVGHRRYRIPWSRTAIEGAW